MDAEIRQLTFQILCPQCQAIVVGLLGSVVAIVMGGIKTSEFELDHAFLLCASSLVTASLASLVLGKCERQVPCSSVISCSSPTFYKEPRTLVSTILFCWNPMLR